jgi:hypothetical protein
VWLLHRHSDNLAARVLTARWRLANDHKKMKAEALIKLLDGRHPLVLSNDEMERLGGQEQGYEQVRKPAPTPADFKHRFELASREHFEWLEAAGTI